MVFPWFSYGLPPSRCATGCVRLAVPHVVGLEVEASVELREERGAALGEVGGAVEAAQGVVLETMVSM